MEAYTTNAKGIIEKNKKIKAGPCIFPFKYKGTVNNECLATPNGNICATEINPKNGIMTKYGYCDITPPKGFKKDTVKKPPEGPVTPVAPCIPVGPVKPGPVGPV